MSKILKLKDGKEIVLDVLYPKERRYNVEDYPWENDDEKDWYKPLTKEEIKNINYIK